MESAALHLCALAGELLQQSATGNKHPDALFSSASQ